MPSSTNVPDNGLDLTPTLGPLYWGFLCSLVLTGINILQGYLYFPTHEAPHLQVTALAMLVLNITSSALVAQSVYYYLVPHFGSLAPLSTITSELSAECLVSTLITFISQGFFAVQLYSVTKIKPSRRMLAVPVIVAVCAIVSFAFGIACTTVMVVHRHNVLAERSVPFSIFFGLAKGFGALTDIIATAAMCLLLASARTGMRSTNSLVATLVQYIMSRGVLVTLIQTLLLVTFHAAPGRLYWLAFHVNVTKLYANTFFSMLHGREQLRLQRGAVEHISFVRVDEGGESARRSAVRFHARPRPESQGDAPDDGLELGVCASDAGHKVIPLPAVTKEVVVREL